MVFDFAIVIYVLKLIKVFALSGGLLLLNLKDPLSLLIADLKVSKIHSTNIFEKLAKMCGIIKAQTVSDLFHAR